MMRGNLIDAPDDEARAERREALKDMLASTGWQSVARPALVARAANVARRLAAGKGLELDEIRTLQAEWHVLQMQIDNPEQFFSNERGFD